MPTQKATRSQVRLYNQQLVLRLVYSGEADNRAALAQKSGLTKPAISNLVAELIEEGLLEEGGFGESTESGGKRPRLLKFVSEARQVIGVSINYDQFIGVMTNLDGQIIAQHRSEFTGTEFDDVYPVLLDVINGLVAQLSAPLLCIGMGVPGVVDNNDRMVAYVPRFGWRNLPLSQILGDHYGVSSYVANDSHLASMALFAFADEPPRGGLATVIVSQTVGVGIVSGNASVQYGSEIGYLRGRDMSTLDERLGWNRVRQRAGELGVEYGSVYLQQEKLSYLHIRQGVENGDAGAIHLQNELAENVVEIFAWIIALVRPQNIALSGKIADLGDQFLDVIVDKLSGLVMPRLIEETSFLVDDSPDLMSVGAAANAIQQELGLATAN
jgi:predicted NBD/HSP70 family sugar kinase